MLRNGGLMKTEALLHVLDVAAANPEQAVNDFQADGMPKRLEDFGLLRKVFLFYFQKDFVQTWLTFLNGVPQG